MPKEPSRCEIAFLQLKTSQRKSFFFQKKLYTVEKTLITLSKYYDKRGPFSAKSLV